MASVGKSKTISGGFELLRYCSKLNYKIEGGFSKLLTQIKKDYPVLYSYMDLRYFNGNTHNIIGNFIKRDLPEYFWCNGMKRISRHKIQKNTLHKIIKNDFDNTLSEDEILNDNGFFKIYDCGYDLYLL